MVVHSHRWKCWHCSARNHLKKRCWNFMISFFFFFQFCDIEILAIFFKKIPNYFSWKRQVLSKKYGDYKNLVWVLVIYIWGISSSRLSNNGGSSHKQWRWQGMHLH
jgi:hypothetical protein